MPCGSPASQKTREVLLFEVGGGRGGLSVQYPSVPLVSPNLLQMESKISAQRLIRLVSPLEVVTLTFPVAYVILPTPAFFFCFLLLLAFKMFPQLLSAFLKSVPESDVSNMTQLS